MTIDQSPITKREMMELLTGFRNEICERFDRHEKRFDGFDMRFDGINGRFTAIDQRFDHLEDLIETVATEVSGVQETLHDHEKRFDHHDELLEALATEVNAISTILEPLVPVQRDHEERISRLERGYAQLILKS